MKNMKFKDYGMFKKHPLYKQCIERNSDLYEREHDIRSPFSRDYTRIIFSEAYRRLKHKTQVFFSPDNDHICTRLEHVNLVESVAFTIAKELGLNTELTRAIAVGHDLGHAPFGHGGERILTEISKAHGLSNFWHEKNSLHFIDNIEILEDDYHNYYNLDLTYAVRDGIVAHCGEMNQQFIQIRNDKIDLNDYKIPGEYNPFTYEGCVVKVSDKIAYLARDIEDAMRLNILTNDDLLELLEQLNCIVKQPFHAINNGSIVNYFIQDVVNNSSIDKGIGLSDEALQVMKVIMKYNYSHIYQIKRVTIHSQYVELVLNSIFNTLLEYKNNDSFYESLIKDQRKYPKLIKTYTKWLDRYSNVNERNIQYKNKIIYDFKHDDKAIEKSIIDYLSGMTDIFIVQIFNELISF